MKLGYANLTLDRANIRGEIPADKDGYRQVVLGALNYANTSGEHYVSDQAVIDLFEKSSTLTDRLAKGRLYVENGHPEFKKGMNVQEYITLLSTRDQKRFCGHIRDVELDWDYAKQLDSVDNEAVIILGSVKPHGELGHILEDSFNTPTMDTCFSVRGGTYNKPVGPITYRELYLIAGWDHVDSGGLPVSSKYLSPSIESESINKEEIMAAYKQVRVDANSPAIEQEIEDVAIILNKMTTHPTFKQKVLDNSRSTALNF